MTRCMIASSLGIIVDERGAKLTPQDELSKTEGTD